MAKVIAISGAQGAGKSTLLEELKSRGFYIDSFKVSRSVQESLGFTSLNDATATLPIGVGFQEKIFEAKLKHDKQLNELPYDVVLVERSFADIYAYSLQWVKKHSTFDKTQSNATLWSFRFKQQCLAAQKLCYNGCILLPYMDHMVWQEDVRRADKNSVDSVYNEIIKFTESSGKSMLQISEKTVGARAVQVQNFLKELS